MTITRHCFAMFWLVFALRSFLCARLDFVAEWWCHSHDSVSPPSRLWVWGRPGRNHVWPELRRAWWIKQTSAYSTTAHHTRSRVCNWGKTVVSNKSSYSQTDRRNSSCLMLHSGRATNSPGGGPKLDSQRQLHGRDGEGEERPLCQNQSCWDNLPQPHH